MAGIRFGCSIGSGAHRIPGRILLQAGNRRKQKSSETAGNQENGFEDGGGPFLVRKFDICVAIMLKTTVKSSKIGTRKYAPFLDRENHCAATTFRTTITAKDAVTRCKCNFRIQDNCHIFVTPTYAAYIPKKLIIS